MVVYLTNAFSLSMLPRSGEHVVRVAEINVEEAKKILGTAFESVVGHAATAQLLSALLNVSVQVNRKEIVLSPGDIVIVFQVMQRLPEGKILSFEELKQINYRFFKVEFLYP